MAPVPKEEMTASLKSYNNRRRKKAFARWKKMAGLHEIDKIKQKTIARRFGLCQSRVHYLIQKYHSARIDGLIT